MEKGWCLYQESKALPDISRHLLTFSSPKLCLMTIPILRMLGNTAFSWSQNQFSICMEEGKT